jgi:hypothetical protein
LVVIFLVIFTSVELGLTYEQAFLVLAVCFALAGMSLLTLSSYSAFLFIGRNCSLRSLSWSEAQTTASCAQGSGVGSVGGRDERRSSIALLRSCSSSKPARRCTESDALCGDSGADLSYFSAWLRAAGMDFARVVWLLDAFASRLLLLARDEVPGSPRIRVLSLEIRTLAGAFPALTALLITRWRSLGSGSGLKASL